MSCVPARNQLTYFYWDDWILSGLLYRGGHTLTLGIALGTGPMQLARTDPAHTQIGVDLDVAVAQCAIRLITSDAITYIAHTPDIYDTIWIDLYAGGDIVDDIFSLQFLSTLGRRLLPNGACFLHLCRQDNRFYRYARHHDVFERALGHYLTQFGYHISILDHYASQTWIFSPYDIAPMRARLKAQSLRRDFAYPYWLDYTCSIIRSIQPELHSQRIEPTMLKQLFHRPIATDTLLACGLADCQTSHDWDSQSRQIDYLTHLASHAPSAKARALALETLSLWLTEVGDTKPTACLDFLRHIANEYSRVACPEFELRRHLIPLIPQT